MLKRIRQFRAIQARRISTASSPYDNYTKLRAFPFRIPPQIAQRQMAPLAALTCGHLGKVLPSLASLFLRFLNFNSMRPVRFSAVYFPAWFVTGEVEASVTYEGVQLKGSAWFNNTYIPGSHVALLSTIAHGIPSSMDRRTVPFTASLLHQHGEPVQCIPFSTSPFSVLDTAASHPLSRSITINEDLSIDPSSVKANLVSAYPVLLPLYLAQYEMQGQKDGANNLFTFIYKAYTPPGYDFIMCENLSKIDPRIGKVIEQSVSHESLGDIFSFRRQLPRVSISDISMPREKIATDSISEWLEELLCSSRNIEILAERSLGVIGKGDEDLRIREMTSEERASLKRYAEITEGIMIIKRGLGASTMLERSNPNGTILLKDRKKMEESIEVLEVKRAQSAPKWWSEWLALH